MFGRLKRTLLIGALALGLAACQQQETESQHSIPNVNIQHWIANSGAKVYFVQSSEVAMVDVLVLFNAGSVRDGADQGVAFVTNHILMQGAGGQSADQLAESFDRVGAVIDTAVDKDMAYLHLRTLTMPAYLRSALKTFTTVLTDPDFTDVGFRRVKQQVVAQFAQQQQQPSRLASITFAKQLYGNSGYAHPVYGTRKSLGSLSLDKLKTFYKQYYVSNNAKVVIVGNVSRSQAEQLTDQVMQGLRSGTRAPVVPALAGRVATVNQHIKFPSSQSHVLIGKPGVVCANPNMHIYDAANYILGGGALVSRLFNEVRNKHGLVYNVSSRFSCLQSAGAFVIGLQTRNKQLPKALTITRGVLQQYSVNGPTPEELDLAKKHMIGEFPLSLASNSLILQSVANIAYYNLPLDYLNTYISKVKALSVRQVKTVFGALMNDNGLITVTVGGTSDESAE